ncbi:MAG TPA: AAC(3) family N-acetyltransferase [Anaerolineales bacterium]|nr:AAC(3) family N-acetyltransferase [Anaerolineales bacterium]
MDGEVSMLGYADLKSAFQELDLADKPIIAHASLKPFGYIQGGAEVVLRAMLASFAGVMMPSFTYKTMVTPEVGPPNNGIRYGAHRDLNKMAEPFTSDMPVDPMMGVLAETLRCHAAAQRTSHPILSFAGIKVEEFLNAQTLYDPLAPIGALAERDGWVVLINVDHTVNTSIHYGEKLAGRKQFVRWALMDNRVVECPGFPGDSYGFNAIQEYIEPHTLRVEMEGGAFIQAAPLKIVLSIVQDMIKKDPLALLCQREDCERCNAVKVTEA